MQKNDIVKVRIEDVGVGGEGIGKVCLLYTSGRSGHVFVFADIDGFLCEALRFLFRVRFVQNLDAVSYTHLDVYKRQELIIGLNG